MAAKKSTKSSAKKPASKGKSTAVRHTPIPQIETMIAAIPAATPEVTYDMIATAAYLRWQSNGGSEFDNWTAAERELRAA